MRPYLFALAVVLASCGGVSESPDGGVGDPPDGGGHSGCVCMALGADYEANVGGIARITLPDMTVETDVAPGAISSDPVARLVGWDVYVVNRFGADNITIIDGVTGQVKEQFTTGPGTNPQDIAVVDDKLYVAAFNSAGILVYDISGAATPAGVIDLSMYDPDGIPNAASVAVVGDRVYAVFTLLDDETFIPRGTGLVAVIDPATDEVETVFDLSNPNPVGFLRERGGDLAIVTAGDYSGTTGCLETLDTSGPGIGACFVDNADVMGVLNAFSVVDGDVYAAAVGATPGIGRLWHIAADGTVDDAPLTPESQEVTDVAHCPATNQLLYNDRATGGLRVWDLTAGEEVTQKPLDIGLPAAFGNGIVCW